MMKNPEIRKTAIFMIGLFLLYLAIQFWPAVSSFLSSVLSAAFPIVLGCMIAYCINILMSFYEKIYFPHSLKSSVRKSRRPVCMIAAMITLVAVVAAVFVLIIPQLVSCFTVLSKQVPGAIENTITTLNQYDLIPADIMSTLSAINWQEKFSEIAKVLVSGLGNVMDVMVSAVSGIAGGVTTGVVALIFAIYLLTGKEKMGSQAKHVMTRYLPQKIYDKIMYVLNIMNNSFHSFIVGQCIEAVILGSLCAIGMTILRLPYASMIGALIGFTALIPVIGAFLGGAVGFIMILTQSFVQAVAFLVFLVILQQLEGNLIYPKVVGSSIGLPGFWVLAVITIGGSVFGIGGILLGVPLTAGIYRIIHNDVHKYDSEPVQEESIEEN